MSKFLEDLFSGVFTPGTNKSLIYATNYSFGALQVVLAALLLVTFSIHFAILSVLSACLWWSINWFVRELEAAKLEQEATKQREARREKEKLRQRSLLGSPQGGATTEAEGDDEDESDTETEGLEQSLASVKGEPAAPLLRLQVSQDDEKLRRRRSAGEAGDLSTEDEWEKVEGK